MTEKEFWRLVLELERGQDRLRDIGITFRLSWETSAGQHGFIGNGRRKTVSQDEAINAIAKRRKLTEQDEKSIAAGFRKGINAAINAIAALQEQP